MRKIGREEHELLARYQAREFTAKELARRMGKTLGAVNCLITRYGYARIEAAKWPPEKIETLLWLNETQAPYVDIAKVMEWWGWGKVTEHQVNGKLCRLRKKGYDIDRRC